MGIDAQLILLNGDLEEFKEMLTDHDSYWDGTELYTTSSDIETMGRRLCQDMFCEPLGEYQTHKHLGSIDDVIKCFEETIAGFKEGKQPFPFSHFEYDEPVVVALEQLQETLDSLIESSQYKSFDNQQIFLLWY